MALQGKAVQRTVRLFLNEFYSWLLFLMVVVFQGRLAPEVNRALYVKYALVRLFEGRWLNLRHV